MSSNDDLGFAGQLEDGMSDYGAASDKSQFKPKVTGRIQPDGRPRDERGNLIDQRRPTLKSFIYGAFNPRRRRIGREDDRDRTFLDWHPTHLLVVCTAILVLSVIDGLLTVRLIGAGLKQINPILAYFISADAGMFSLSKIALTTVGLFGLVLTAHMRIYNLVKSSTVLYGFLLIYILLVLYECYLAQGIS